VRTEAKLEGYTGKLVRLRNPAALAVWLRDLDPGTPAQ
jgi:hypothetical protein